MTLIFCVDCPECNKGFYCDVELYPMDVELHCPYCGLYFKKEASPKVGRPLKESHDLITTTGKSQESFKIYKPAHPLRLKRN